MSQIGLRYSGSATVGEAATDPATAEVSGMLLRALGGVAMQFGISPATLFRDEAERYASSEPIGLRVPLEVYRSLLTRAIVLTGDPALGLRCGSAASESAFDPLAPLVANAATLRQALQMIWRFQSLALEGISLHLTENAETAGLHCELPRSHKSTDRFLAEFAMGGFARVLRYFGCRKGDLHAVCFEHKRPSYHHVYAEVFADKSRFAQPFTGLMFAAHLLDRPHLRANSALRTHAHSQAVQRLVGFSRRTDLIGRLRAYLLQQPASQLPDMPVAARELGVSVRTLRRRLAQAGESFRTLTQEVQASQARDLLGNQHLKLKAVAKALGFASVEPFHRAFKRWTGLTPLQYRYARLRPTVGVSRRQPAGSARRAASSRSTGKASRRDASRRRGSA
jgi:AraC-like DNA-binding protein